MNIGCNYNRKKWKRNDVARVLTIMKAARVLTVMKAARVYAEARPPTTGISDAILEFWLGLTQPYKTGL
jgi:hypothetical protein